MWKFRINYLIHLFKIYDNCKNQILPILGEKDMLCDQFWLELNSSQIIELTSFI